MPRIEAAPASHAATAGALVNLGRVLGSCIGISAASSMLSWRLAEVRGPATMGPVFVEAVAGSLLVLAVFAVVAMAASLAFKRTGFTTLHKT